MARTSPLIATGVIHLDRDTSIPLYVHTDGVKILVNGTTPGKFFEQLPSPSGQSTVKGEGHLVFTNLLVAPVGTSFPAKLEYSAQQLTLSVDSGDGTFGLLPNAQFEQLKVTLTETKTGPLVVSEAGVNMMLFKQRVPLTGVLTTRGLVFQLAAATFDVNIPSIGTANLNAVTVQADEKRWENLQLLYNFGETANDWVYDNSGNSPGLDLKIKNTKKVAGGGLAVAATSQVGTPPNIMPLTDTISRSNAFTVELWIKYTGSGTAGNQEAAILVLGNGRVPGKTFFEIKLVRNGQLTVDGTYTAAGPLESIVLPKNQLTHIAFSHDSSGKEQLYVNGRLEKSRTTSSKVANFADAIELTLGNTPKKSSAWEGEFYHVAIHDRALSEQEILLHFRPQAGVQGQFTIANAPAPLNTGLPATFDLFTDTPAIEVKTGALELIARPELHFSKLNLRWQQSAQDTWQLSGDLDASFWQNKVSLAAKLIGTKAKPRLEFTQKQQPVALGLDDWGHFEFTTLTLNVTATGAPAWELATTPVNPPFTILPGIRFREFDLFADFLLADYGLSLNNEHLLLSGSWLDETVVFHGTRLGGDLLMQASADFDMLFDFSLPVILDSNTKEVLNNGAELVQHPIHIALALELNRNGLLTKVGGDFKWKDDEGVDQDTTIPGFTLYTPPPNKNAILGHITREVTAHSSELFENTGKQAIEYNLEIGTNQPKIFLSTPLSDKDPTKETVLPGRYGDYTSTPNGVFQLLQSENSCTLNLKTDKTQSEIDADYLQLLKHLAAESVGLAETALLRRRIAERLPLPYDRLMYYYYGWDRSGNYLDLQPGMRLRLDFQHYQFVQASDQTAARGFSGSGSTYVYLAAYTHKSADNTYRQLLGFDAFLSQLNTEGPVNIARDGAGGLFDLLREENRKAAYRLFFPLNPSTGLGPERVATIIGADSLQEMIDATDDFDPDANIAPGKGISFFFRGKTTIIPEIQVFVRDQLIYVPVGTTLRQLMQRFDDLPPAGPGNPDLSALFKPGKPLRLMHEGVNNKATYRFINLQDAGVINHMDVLDLPLIKGDRFYF